MRGVTCLNCGIEYSTESRFCRKCGRPLPTICLKCDTENHWRLASCRGCGANLLGQELKEEKLAVDAELIKLAKNYLSSADKKVKAAVVV